MKTDSRRRHAVALSIASYVVLLAGQLSPSRIGIDIELPIPANFLAACGILILLGLPALHTTSTRTSARVPGLVLILALLGVLVISALWSEGNSRGEEIWAILAMAVLLACVAISLRLSVSTTVLSLMICTAVAGAIYSGFGLLAFGALARVSVFGGGPNVFGRVTGLGMVAIVYLVAKYRTIPWLAILLVPMGIATVLSGSRGAMLGTVAALLIVVIVMGKRVLSRILLGTAIAFIPGLLLYERYGEPLHRVFMLRIVKLTLEDGYLAGRDDLWTDALDYISRYPLAGSGLGAFISQVGTYPHDLPLQVAVDAGAIGVVAFVLCIGYFARFAITLRPGNMNGIGSAACACLIFIASLFSGGYYDSRFMWVWLIVMSTSAGAIEGRPSALLVPGERAGQPVLGSQLGVSAEPAGTCASTLCEIEGKSS